MSSFQAVVVEEVVETANDLFNLKKIKFSIN